MHDASAQTPIANIHLFKPSRFDWGFTEWKNKRLMSIGDLHVDGKFASFAQLQSAFNLPGFMFKWSSHILSTNQRLEHLRNVSFFFFFNCL